MIQNKTSGAHQLLKSLAAKNIIFSALAIFAVGSTLFGFQNCSKFSALSTAQVYAGSSYCAGNPKDSACTATVQPICNFNGQVVANGASLTAYLSSTGSCSQETRTCTNGVLSGSYSYASCSASGPASCLLNGVTVASGTSTTTYLSSVASTCTSQTRTCTDGVLNGSYLYPSCSTSGALSCIFNGQTLTHGQSVLAYSTSEVAYGSTCTPSTRVCLNGALTGSGDYGFCIVDVPAACLFNGATLASGSAATAFLTSSVAYGSTCQSETRACTNGALSGSDAYGSCVVDAPASCLINGQTIPSGGSLVLYALSSAPQNPGCQAETRTCTNGTLSGSATASSCTETIQTSFTSFSLAAGQSLRSGHLTLSYQTDGNLVLYQTNSFGTASLWSSLTGGLDCSANCTAAFQSDANLVLYKNGAAYWSSGTSGYPSSQLTFSSAPPYLTITSSSGVYLWSAMTFWDYILGSANLSRCIPDATIATPLCQSLKVMDQNKSALYYRNDGLIQVYDYEPSVGLIGVVKDGTMSGAGGAPWLRCLSDVPGACQNMTTFALGQPRFLQPPVISASQFNVNQATSAGLTTSAFKTFYVNMLNPYTCDVQPSSGTSVTSSKSFVIDRVDFGGDLGIQTNVLVVESVGIYPAGATDPWKGVALERYWYIGQGGVVREENFMDSGCQQLIACQAAGTADCSQYQCTGNFTSATPGTSTWTQTKTPNVTDIVEYCKNPTGGQAPIGFFDSAVSGGTLSGWALDPDTPATSISIHVYADGVWGSGTFVAATPANLPRADINWSTGYTGNHAFSITIPAKWQGHALYIYALDSGGGKSPVLSGSPRQF